MTVREKGERRPNGPHLIEFNTKINAQRRTRVFVSLSSTQSIFLASSFSSTCHQDTHRLETVKEEKEIVKSKKKCTLPQRRFMKRSCRGKRLNASPNKKGNCPERER